MMSNEDAVKAFRDCRNGNSKNIFHETSKLLYSYGHHFVLAVWMGQYYLINGDTYSSSTSAHTSLCIKYLRPHIIIPFSALRRIGWDNENIVVVDTMPDVYIARQRWDAKAKEMVEYQEHRLGSSVFEFNGKCYLSSIDAGAKSGRSGYFLVELPGAVSNVEEAFDALLPVDLQETDNYVRQGEFFFVPCPEVVTRTLQPMDDMFEWGLYDYVGQKSIREKFATKENAEQRLSDLEDRWAPFDGYSTLFAVHRFPIGDACNLARYFSSPGTGNPHNAREIRHLGDIIFARGRVRHPQHKDLNLGNTWHRVYINNAVRSFNSSGNVD